MRHTSRLRQRGSVIITVCLLTLFLLGFIGFALDFGRLFIVKTELQTAMDACALAAAQELDSMPASIDRARAAGMTAGNLNAVNLQSANWSGKGQLVSTEITFLNGSYTATVNPLVAQYAQCQHVQPAVQLWLLQAMGAFTNNVIFANTHDVWANAVATRASSQTSCPIPVALKPKVGFENDPTNNYGFTPGEWIPLIMGAGASTNGEIGWANLDGTNSASETVAEMNGKCGSQIGDDLGTPGVQAAVADVWNYRFGIYRNGVSPATPATHNPDYSGYAYTDTNWPPDPANPNVRNAYFGAPYADPTGTAENFATKRANFASCDDDGTRMRGGPSHSCESITGLALNSFQDLAAPGPTAVGGHKDHGRDRRTVIVPVTRFQGGAWEVVDWTCMLMLQPLSIPLVEVKLEFIGLAGAPGVPCATSGMPGGWAGPKVPQLVR
jgi:Flp pilus assembly protein TadG